MQSAETVQQSALTGLYEEPVSPASCQLSYYATAGQPPPAAGPAYDMAAGSLVAGRLMTYPYAVGSHGHAAAGFNSADATTVMNGLPAGIGGGAPAAGVNGGLATALGASMFAAAVGQSAYNAVNHLDTGRSSIVDSLTGKL